MLRVSPRNSDALETVSMSEPFLKLNMQSVGRWWKLDQLEMPSRRSSVCIISHVTGRCYIGETNRPSEVRIREHKYYLTQSLLGKSKLAPHAYEKCHKICWKEQIADWTEHHLQEIQRIHPRVFGRSSDQSTQLGHLSHLDSHYRSRSQKTTTPSSVDYVWKMCCYVGIIQRVCIFSDDLYSDITLILTTIVVK
jgi:hypothetical protein